MFHKLYHNSAHLSDFDVQPGDKLFCVIVSVIKKGRLDYLIEEGRECVVYTYVKPVRQHQKYKRSLSEQAGN